MENIKNRKLTLYGLLLFAGLSSVAIFFFWMLYFRFEEHTSDAYVNGNIVAITPQVPGIVSYIYSDNTDFVEENQLLVELDSTSYRLELEKSISNLRQTVREVSQLFIKVKEQQANLEVKQNLLHMAEKDYRNRLSLVEIGGVSKEEFEHITSSLFNAKASYKEAYHGLQLVIAEVQNTTIRNHPSVIKAINEIKTNYLNLKRCKIVAPVTGYVTMRSVQLGESVSNSSNIMAVVPLSQIWVDANYKETQLSKIRIGQHVHITSDMYGSGIVFNGKVVGVNPGSGNVFSLLPPQNATGNWVKILQRVPVKISLDEDQIKKYPLYLGLSMNVKIDIKDTSGDMLSKKSTISPIYKTDSYKLNEDEVDELIEEIIKNNILDYE